MKFQLVLLWISRIWPAHAVLQDVYSVHTQHIQGKVKGTNRTKWPTADLPQSFYPLLLSEDAASEESGNMEDRKLKFLCNWRHLVRHILLGGKSCQQQPENERLHLGREDTLQGRSQLGTNTWTPGLRRFGFKEEKSQRTNNQAVAFPCFLVPTQLVHAQSASRTGNTDGLNQQGGGWFLLANLHFFSSKHFFQTCLRFTYLPQEDINWATSLKQLPLKKKKVCTGDCRCKLFTLVTMSCKNIKGFHRFCGCLEWDRQWAKIYLEQKPPVSCSLAVLPA